MIENMDGKLSSCITRTDAFYHRPVLISTLICREICIHVMSELNVAHL